MKQTGSVLLLFAFEYLILCIATLSIYAKYIIHYIDSSIYSNQWNGRSTAMFYLEFITDLLRLFLYLIFFTVICSYYGLPLHLIRELCVTFYSLRERILKFIAYKRLTSNM